MNKLRTVCLHYENIRKELEALDAVLSEIDKSELTNGGKEFVESMAWYHRRARESWLMHSSEVAEVEHAVGLPDDLDVLKGLIVQKINEGDLTLKEVKEAICHTRKADIK